jgi:hypothetical protein
VIINSLADIPDFTARPHRRSAPARRVVSWILVGLIHAVILSIFIISQPIPSLHYGKQMEMILQLPGVSNARAPSVDMVQPKAPLGSQPEVIPAPITIPPLPPLKPGAPESHPGDLLGSIGQALACGASNFENLNPAQQARCRHIPWQGARLPNGAIVLDRPSPASKFAAPAPEFRITGQDAQRRDLETSSPCPVMLNVPCLNNIPGRN